MRTPDGAKRMSVADVVARLSDGMTIGIGGWGTRRKPMAMVREILRSRLRDLRVVSCGGPDVGLLCAAGKVREVVSPFVSLEPIPYEPWFGRAREAGLVDTVDLDEGMLLAGLRAAAWRLPFLPIRAGLGTDVLTVNPGLRTVRSPYPDGEELVAMPALRLDVALVHINESDVFGNARCLGADPYLDDLFCLAADRRYVSCERIVGTAALRAGDCPQSMLLNRSMVDGVVEIPGGARFTSCEPDYGRDEPLLRRYADDWTAIA
jgi:glutaconate CoA-transferase subunit A